ncbi:hypothetical protein [Bizionia arctica]|uniref:Uncharacterized protein n=1 Tax=Bizionia arctica TaxID=1495645 RepID=A0A917GMX9_9FLAO|nr:hypothetical protein [Bizionia arctica]GGG51628.1 hypothetical protein GCM10010976_23500 [Bizionia arctica]
MSKTAEFNPKDQNIFKQFKDNHIEYELTNIFEILLPFWECTKSIVAETETDIDRFSKIILQTIEADITSQKEICAFLGIKEASFVTVQFHFLIKNEMIIESIKDNETHYQITHNGKAFLQKKKKLKSLETIPFRFKYNDLLQSFFNPDIAIDRQGNKKENIKKATEYKLLETRLLDYKIIKIKHNNKPNKINTLELATFFNQQHPTLSFFDEETNKIETHRRSISFLAIEYSDITGSKRYDIRRHKKTVHKFDKNDLEENLSKCVTDYFAKFPL